MQEAFWKQLNERGIPENIHGENRKLTQLAFLPQYQWAKLCLLNLPQTAITPQNEHENNWILNLQGYNWHKTVLRWSTFAICLTLMTYLASSVLVLTILVHLATFTKGWNLLLGATWKHNGVKQLASISIPMSIVAPPSSWKHNGVKLMMGIKKIYLQ